MAKIRVRVPKEPFPIRGVIIWPLAFNVVTYPQLSSWQLCNGAGGAPDYRGYHLRGAANDAAVGTVVGADTHTHVSGLTIDANGDHTHTVSEEPDHCHSICEYCHCHSDTGLLGPPPCPYLEEVDQNLDGATVEVASSTYEVGIQEDCHNHIGTVGEDGSTGPAGCHTHTLGTDGDHTHTVSGAIAAGSSIPKTRYCHFIQYTG